MRNRCIFFILTLLLGGGALYAQPKINVTNKDVCVPGFVTVFANNCATCNKYEWDFGRGFLPGNDTFKYLVTDTGQHVVRLRYTTTGGTVGIVVLNNAFRGRVGPEIKLIVDKPSLCGNNDTVTITDVTPNILYRDWSLEGFVIRRGPKVIQRKFTSTPGYKEIFVESTDSFGCKSQMVFDSLIGVWNPININMKASSNAVCKGRSVLLTAQIDSFEQNIKRIQWTVSGVSPGVYTSRNPVLVTLSNADTFDVTLEVQTLQGCTTELFRNNFLSSGDSAAMTVSLDRTSACINGQINGTALGSLTGNPRWTFTGVPVGGVMLRGSKVDIRAKDTGWLNLLVTDTSRGCISRASLNKAVYITGPKAGFVSQLRYYCNTPDTFVFINTSSPLTSGVTTYRWELRDKFGSVVSTGANNNFIYYTNVRDTFSARIIAIGDNGCRDTFERQRAVMGGPLNASFKLDRKYVCPGQLFRLVPNKDTAHSRYPNRYQWRWYNASGVQVGSSTQKQPIVNYANEGTYSASLVLTNAKGCKDSVFLKDTIKVYKPKVELIVPDTFVCLNEKFNFYARVTNRDRGRSLWILNNIDSNKGTRYFYQDTVIGAFLQFSGRYVMTYRFYDSLYECVNDFVYPFKLKVSGMKYKIAANPNVGCAPLLTNLTATRLANADYEKPGNAYNFKWKSIYKNKISFSPDNIESTSASVDKGIQFTYFVFTNGSGCKDSTSEIRIESGVRAGFYVQGRPCVGNTIDVIGTSSNWATEVEYYLGDTLTFQFASSRFDKNPKLRVKAGGYSFFSAIAKYNNCRDTYTVIIRGEDIQASFTSNDSISLCAPKLVTFKNNTAFAYENWWDFGDGQTGYSKGSDNIGNLYRKNKPSGYDVTLIVSSYLGCRDTLVRKKFAKVLGPVADVSLQNTKGCEPLLTRFINNSTDFERFYLDYGDGSVQDSVFGKQHAYIVNDKTKDEQTYYPRLALYDSTGCFVLADITDSIVVKKSPEADFLFTSRGFTQGNKGCAPLLVSFRSTSLFYQNLYWDYDKDGNIDGNLITPNHTYMDGKFVPRLIAENFNGCRDTVQKDTIEVWPTPSPDFRSAADSVCAFTPLKFTYTGSSAVPIKKYEWDFGEPGLTDTSFRKDPKYAFKNPLSNLVTLKVTDIRGCVNEKKRGQFVFDTAGPAKPKIYFITVKNNQTVEVVWKKTSEGNVDQYQVYIDSTNYFRRYTTSVKTDTTYSKNYGNLVSNKRFCYTVRMTDTCGFSSDYGMSHCTIVLRDSVWEPYHVRLNWLSYEGWGAELGRYEVFRSENGGGSWVKVADVSKNRQFYVDSFLCDKTYCYYVEAVHFTNKYRSRSNEICRKPIYMVPQTMVPVLVATVEEDQKAKIAWSPYPTYVKGGVYVVERTRGMGMGFATLKEEKGLFTKDLTGRVDEAPHAYRVRYKDHCGGVGPAGVFGRTIYLSGTVLNDKVDLNWTPYGYWYSGVKEYILQQWNGQAFATIGLFTSSQLEAKEVSLADVKEDSGVFRVLAVKDSVTRDTSVSNIAYFVPASRMLIPSAFSPNGDGLNDEFKIDGAYLYNNNLGGQYRFQMVVYNRWGQKVFESFDYRKGWDGKFGGETAPAGHYAYTVRAIGLDGKLFVREGTVNLLR